MSQAYRKLPAVAALLLIALALLPRASADPGVTNEGGLQRATWDFSTASDYVTANVTLAVRDTTLARTPMKMGVVPRKSVTVAAETPSFARLLAALSERDLPTTTAPCLAYEEVEIPVFAQTPDGTYRVRQPRDGCGLNRREVYAAIDAAVGTQR